MSLLDDEAAFRYYESKGLDREYLEGTLTWEQIEQAAIARSRAPVQGADPVADHEWLRRRGD